MTGKRMAALAAAEDRAVARRLDAERNDAQPRAFAPRVELCEHCGSAAAVGSYQTDIRRTVRVCPDCFEETLGEPIENHDPLAFLRSHVVIVRVS